MKRNISCGFTLLELIIVVAIIGIVAVGGAASYRNFGKDVELSTVADVLRADLKHMQAKSMAGEDGVKWGAHLVNGATDYYELFSTPTTYSNGSMVVLATTTLGAGISFSDPLPGSSKDILFTKISGGTSATTTTLTYEDLSEVITVTEIGTIY